MKTLRGRRLRRWPGLPTRLTIGLVSLLLLAAFPLVVLAADIFGDVPTGAQFHDQIEAIALAGITTGCTATPTYCPEDTVTRKAMAAFMARGYGRVAALTLPVRSVPTSEGSLTGWSTTLTPGLPAGALSGAAGFIKADAAITISHFDGTGFCAVAANLLVDGTPVTTYRPKVSLVAGTYATIALTGAARVTSSGARTIEVRVYRTDGTCSAFAEGGSLTATYLPFGSAGTNAL